MNNSVKKVVSKAFMSHITTINISMLIVLIKTNVIFIRMKGVIKEV